MPTFTYTGAQQTYVVPAGITTVEVECWGGQGGNASGGAKGGLGGYAKGTLAVSPGETLYVYVAGAGVSSTAAVARSPGGWNGGGIGGDGANGSEAAGGGGGGSDIRKGGNSLADRKIVAAGGGGGGGGSSSSGANGGAGGGLTGDRGVGSSSPGLGGYGGTQSAGGMNGAGGTTSRNSSSGSLGQGGYGSFGLNAYGSGGGGGGYYGGGGGTSNADHGQGYSGGGGGGSSYVGGVTSSTTTTGVRTGSGQVIITALNSPPVTTITAPAPWVTVDPRFPLTVSWTYSDPEGSPQAEWQIAVRVDGEIWNFLSEPNANKSTVIPAEYLPDESEITLEVGASDGAGWTTFYDTVTFFTASWTYGAEVTTSTQSVSVGPFAETGTHEVQVRTADAVGFGPWSTSVSFSVVEIKAANLNAVPAQLNLGVTAPMYGVGKSVFANARTAVPITSYAALPYMTAVGVIKPPVPKVTLAASLEQHLGGAATVYHVPVEQPVFLYNGGPITIYWNGLFAVAAGVSLYAAPPANTVYIRPTVPVYTTQQYRVRFTDGFTRITRRVEILKSDGETLWDDKAGNKSRLIAGGVSVDYTRDERRSADLELANFDGALVHKPGGFWYDKTMRLYRGIEFYDESGMREYEVPVGTFMIDRVSEARFPKSVKVTARDFTKKCMLSKFTQATAFEANERVEDIIKALAANCGVHNRVLPTTGKTLGITYTFERGKTRWEAMKEIATAFGYELFFDAQGYLVMREFLDPTLSPVSHEFLTGPSVGNLVDWNKSANDTRIFNHISVIGADTDTVPVWADAYNNNPLSPTNIDLLGDRVDTYESALVTTFEQAEELAAMFLKIAALEEYEINLQSIVYPWLEAGEIIRFRDPERNNENEPDRFLLTNFDIPMGLQPMSATGRRVTIVS